MDSFLPEFEVIQVEFSEILELKIWLFSFSNRLSYYTKSQEEKDAVEFWIICS